MVLEGLLRHGLADGPIYNETKRYGDLESGLDTAYLAPRGCQTFSTNNFVTRLT